MGYNAFCYGIFETNTSWSDAEHFCGNRSGHLATVNSRYKRNDSYWAALVNNYRNVSLNQELITSQDTNILSYIKI